MAGHQVWHQILLRAVLLVELFILPPELQKNIEVGLAHVVQYRADTVLRRHLQLAGDVVLHQLLEEVLVLVLQHIVVADAGADEHLLDLGQLPHFLQQLRVLGVIGVQIGAGLRRKAAAVLAHTALLLLLAAGVAEVGAGAAHIVDIALELGILRQQPGLLHHRLDGAAGDHASLMERQCAEVAAAEAAPVVGDGEPHLLNGGDARGVHGVYLPRIGQGVQVVQLLPAQGTGGGIHHQQPPLAGLEHGAAPDGVVLVVFDLRGAGVGLLVGADLLVGGAGRLMEAAAAIVGGDIGRAWYVGDLLHRRLFGETAGDLRRGALAHTVDQQVGGGVEQDAPAHLILPVVVVGEAPQRRLQSADDDGRVGERLPRPVGIDDGRTVGTVSHLAAGAVQIPCAAALGHRVVGHHGVQIAAADEHAVPGLAHGAERLRRVPVRLGQNGHAVALRLQQAGDEGGAEAGVVDVAVCSDHQKIIVIPAALDHLLAADRQKYLVSCHGAAPFRGGIPPGSAAAGRGCPFPSRRPPAGRSPDERKTGAAPYRRTAGAGAPRRDAGSTAARGPWG